MTTTRRRGSHAVAVAAAAALHVASIAALAAVCFTTVDPLALFVLGNAVAVTFVLLGEVLKP